MRARISSGVRDVEAEHRHAPLRRLDEAEQRLEHRALAGAVRTQQADGAPENRAETFLSAWLAAVDDRYVFEVYDRRVGSSVARLPGRDNVGSIQVLAYTVS